MGLCDLLVKSAIILLPKHTSVLIIFYAMSATIAAFPPDFNTLKFVAVVSEMNICLRWGRNIFHFSAPGLSTRWPLSGTTIRQWSIRKLFLAWRIWCTFAKRCTSNVRHGEALAIEIYTLAAIRRFLHKRKHASFKQSSGAMPDECRKFAGRIDATSGVWKLFAGTVATSCCKCDTSWPRYREEIELKRIFEFAHLLFNITTSPHADYISIQCIMSEIRCHD